MACSLPGPGQPVFKWAAARRDNLSAPARIARSSRLQRAAEAARVDVGELPGGRDPLEGRLVDGPAADGDPAVQPPDRLRAQGLGPDLVVGDEDDLAAALQD